MNWLSIRTASRTVPVRLFGSLLLAGSLWMPLAAQEEETEETSPEIEVSSSFEEAVDRYGGEPVEAIEVRGPNQRKNVTLVGFGPSGLTLRYPDLEAPLTIPEEGLNATLQFSPEIDNELYRQLMEAGRSDEALELIRKETYPLLKFVPTDPQKVRIHGQVDALVRLLIANGKIDEASSLIESLGRERLSTTFAERAIEVASLLVEEGELDRAYDLVKRMPLGPGDTTYASLYLQLANDLRENEDWENARALYKDVQLASSASETPEAFLWEAYIHLQEDRPFMVSGIVEQVGRIEPESRYYSLLQLITGVSLSLEGERQQALSTFARGIVYATTNDPWTPELLYRAAEKYEEEGLELAALEIRNELEFFYPDSVWAERI